MYKPLRGVINGFEFIEYERETDHKKILIIRYLKSGKFFANSMKYENVSEEKKDKIIARLLGYMSTNLMAEQQSQTVSLIEIIRGVERIIFDK